MKFSLLIIFIAFVTSSDEHRDINDPETISAINQKATTWVAGENSKFDNLKIKDSRILLGYKRDSNAARELPDGIVTQVQGLPVNFDLRKAWPQCGALREIRDQSSCGSCWAFGAVEVMSDRICIFNKGLVQVRISAEHLLSCCKFCGDGCNGGDPAAAFLFWRTHGIPTGGLYNDFSTCQPYSFPPCGHHVNGTYLACPEAQSATPQCSHACVQGYRTPFQQDRWFAKSVYYVPTDETSIMSEIHTNGSVSTCYEFFEDLLYYKSGVYQYTHGKSLGLHCVKMIGWGVENGVKYWTIVNSWNETWGDKGTFKILRGVNHLGIEGEVVAGIPKLSSTLNFLN